MSEASKPPVTNRGVKCANDEEYLSALIDWCQITIWNVSPKDISEKILRIPFFLMSNDLRGGLQGGYRALMCFDDIRVYEPSNGRKEQGYQILMSGKGCRNFEKFLEANEETWFDFFDRVLQYKVNFPRIDLAIDDKKTYFKISELINRAEQGLAISRLRLGSAIGAFTLANGVSKGSTLNIGSRQSEFFMTFYEKGYERAAKFGITDENEIPDWNRYGLKFRQGRAVRLAEALVKRREVFTVAMEVLNDSIRFVEKPVSSKDNFKRRYPLWQPWADFMHEVGKLKLTMKPEAKDYYKRLSWIAQSVAPTLRVYRKIDKTLGTTFLDMVIDNAIMTQKHTQMYEDYIKQLKTEAIMKNMDIDVVLYEKVVQMQKEGWTFHMETPFD